MSPRVISVCFLSIQSIEGVAQQPQIGIRSVPLYIIPSISGTSMLSPGEGSTLALDTSASGGGDVTERLRAELLDREQSISMSYSLIAQRSITKTLEAGEGGM